MVGAYYNEEATYVGFSQCYSWYAGFQRSDNVKKNPTIVVLFPWFQLFLLHCLSLSVSSFWEEDCKSAEAENMLLWRGQNST